MQFYYIHTDHQGSVIAITDAEGDFVFQATYDAWGRQTVTKNDIAFFRGYTGHEMLNEYGLINMNGRLYDPCIGRFLSPDNYVQQPTNSQNFNRYNYCLNNPLKYTDPSGEIFEVIGAFAALFAVGNTIAHASRGDISHHGFWKSYIKTGSTYYIDLLLKNARIDYVNPANYNIKKDKCMEMKNDSVILKHEESPACRAFSLNYGQALFLFASPPKDNNVKYINSHAKICHCLKEPCWVKCEAYHCNRDEIKLINNNIRLFKELGVFPQSKTKISQKDISQLEGGDIRLMNLLLCRLQDEDFIELNVVGLSFESIERVLRFVVTDIPNNKVAYIIIEYTDLFNTFTNPIDVCEDNISKIIKELEVENIYRKIKMS